MFNPARIIQKKRDEESLSHEELKFFIEGILKGEVADYQASAFLMAVYFRGMTLEETVTLTRVMAESGERYDLSSIEGPKVDKHSTGGIGDKVSLILVALAAACGLKVPMMAGRGLGHSGGTIDKFESIAGYSVDLSKEKIYELLRYPGCVMFGQSEQIVPADKRLYALRDVTATVECIPLIVASILSKKLSEGAEGLVLDVKVGSGAFMKTLQEAKNLAKTLVLVGRKLGLKCRALITDMNQPLGYATGNSLEVIESIEILRNTRYNVFKQGDSRQLPSTDLKEVTLQLCAQMLVLGGKVRNIQDGRKLAIEKLQDGSAWRIFIDMVTGQGGNIFQIEDPMKLPISSRQVVWKAKHRGYITQMDTEAIGHILVDMGAGRKKAGEQVDPSVGLIFHKKLGARVANGDTLVTAFAKDGMDLKSLEHRFQEAIHIHPTRKPVPKLIVAQL